MGKVQNPLRTRIRIGSRTKVCDAEEIRLEKKDLNRLEFSD